MSTLTRLAGGLERVWRGTARTNGRTRLA